MTTYEHAMFGATLALALGSKRRQGWGVVVAAGTAAALPDWDGLSILFGGDAFRLVHRTWGHNFLVIAGTSAAIGLFGYLCRFSARMQRLLLKCSKKPVAASPLEQLAAERFSSTALMEWIIICVLASILHLPADAIYSGRPEMAAWPVKIYWPFSDAGWDWQLVPWGDVGAVLIFVAEMFGLYRRPDRERIIAWGTLILLFGYVLVRWLL